MSEQIFYNSDESIPFVTNPITNNLIVNNDLSLLNIPNAVTSNGLYYDISTKKVSYGASGGVIAKKGLYCLKTSNQTITNTLTKISFSNLNTNFNNGFTVDLVNSKIVCNHTNSYLVEIEAQISTQIPQQIEIILYENNLPKNNMGITQYINSSGSTQLFRMSGVFYDLLIANDFIEFYIISQSNTTPSPTLTTSTTLTVPTITIPSFKIVITEI